MLEFLTTTTSISNYDCVFVVGKRAFFEESVREKISNGFYAKDLNDFDRVLNDVKVEITDKVGIFLSDDLIVQKEMFSQWFYFKSFYCLMKAHLNERVNTFNGELLTQNNPVLLEFYQKFVDLNSGGKFIRGMLVNLGYHLMNGDYHDSIDLGLAFEIFQTAILVHDDIIDQADLRRSKETIHHSIFQKYKDYGSSIEREKFSEALALCMGDLGFYLSSNVILSSYPLKAQTLLTYFNQVVIQTIHGEILDVLLPFEQKYKVQNVYSVEDNVMQIYELKTSFYTMIGPMVLGMLLGDASGLQISDITTFCKMVGVAFQIQDDLLGIYGDEKVLGKPVGSDISEFKQTLLYSFIAEKKKEYLPSLLEFYGKKDITSEDVVRVQVLFEESGARNYATEKMETLFHESSIYLEKIDWLSLKQKQLLKGFLLYLQARKK